MKVEPRHWITNFEPNYLPYIEFYEEDFPWRYTPAAPDLAKHRLRPWLALVVMKEDEFKDSPVAASRPLPAIEVTAQPDVVFPPADQLWAWAHVHVNKDLIAQDGVFVSTDTDAARARLENLLRSNPDHAYSRIVCPRQLEPDVGYHAFLIPSFESGRLAGLGLDASAGQRRLLRDAVRVGRLCGPPRAGAASCLSPLVLQDRHGRRLRVPRAAAEAAAARRAPRTARHGHAGARLEHSGHRRAGAARRAAARRRAQGSATRR